MTSGRPIRPAIPRHRVTRQRPHVRPLIAAAVGLHLGAAALWLVLATGEASAGSPPLPTVPASPSGSPDPSTAPSASAPPTSSPASVRPPTPRPGQGGVHHAPTRSPTAAVVAPAPTTPSVARVDAQVPAPARAPDPGSAPRPGPDGAVLDGLVGPPDAHRALDGRLAGWWLPGSVARPLIVSGTAALIVAIAGLFVVRRRREF